MIPIAVLGCGRIGAMHAANIAAHPSARLAGVQDIAGRAIAWGFDMATVSGDSRLLAGVAAASVAKFRQLAGQTGSKSEKGAS